MTEKTDRDSKAASRAGKALSKLGAAKGGKARGHVLTAEERKEIARNAVRARWKKYYAKHGKPERKPTDQRTLEKTRKTREKMKEAADEGQRKAMAHSMLEGELSFGTLTFGCHVLNDGRRVITQTEIVRAITGTQASNLSRYLARNPLVQNNFGHRPPIRFSIPGRSVIATGFEATAMIEICDIYLEARGRGMLRESQMKLAVRAEVIIRSCAKLGIVALIDEATGYQDLRAKNALRLKLQAFIAEELQEWAKVFPDEFWLELARLEGIRYSARNRPLRWGKYVMAFVYDAIDKDVGKQLRSKEPESEIQE